MFYLVVGIGVGLVLLTDIGQCSWYYFGCIVAVVELVVVVVLVVHIVVVGLVVNRYHLDYLKSLGHCIVDRIGHHQNHHRRYYPNRSFSVVHCIERLEQRPIEHELVLVEQQANDHHLLGIWMENWKIAIKKKHTHTHRHK